MRLKIKSFGKKSFLSIFVLLFFFQLNIIFSKSIKNPWDSIKKDTVALEKKVNTKLDNEYIQIYQNHEGLWLKVYSYYHFVNYKKKYGFTTAEFEKINKVKVNRYLKFNNDYFFLPFSKTYSKRLKKKYIVRQSISNSKGDFIWPIKGVRITSRLGMRWGGFHTGIDIAAGVGTIVVAAKSGVVSVSGNRGAYGVTIFIENEKNIETIYGHLSYALVKKGDIVRKGQIIGFSGNTGKSTGPHLHFEVRCRGIILDPESFLPPFKKSMDKFVLFKNNLKEKVKQN